MRYSSVLIVEMILRMIAVRSMDDETRLTRYYVCVVLTCYILHIVGGWGHLLSNIETRYTTQTVAKLQFSKRSLCVLWMNSQTDFIVHLYVVLIVVL